MAKANSSAPSSPLRNTRPGVPTPATLRPNKNGSLVREIWGSLTCSNGGPEPGVCGCSRLSNQLAFPGKHYDAGEDLTPECQQMSATGVIRQVASPPRINASSARQGNAGRTVDAYAGLISIQSVRGWPHTTCFLLVFTNPETGATIYKQLRASPAIWAAALASALSNPPKARSVSIWELLPTSWRQTHRNSAYSRPPLGGRSLRRRRS